MRRLQQQFPNEVVVIGVHSAKFPSEQLTANIRNAVMRLGIQHAVVNDAGLKIWNSYAVRAWPTLVVIDPRGRIAGEISGEVLAEDLAATVEEIIADQADLLDRSPLELRKETRLEPEFLLRYPSKLLATPQGLLYIADTGHHRIIEARLSADLKKGEVLRVFGRGNPGLQDGPPQEARFQGPRGMALNASGDSLYVADTDNHAVRAIHLETGAVRTVAGTGQKAHGRYALGAPTQTPLRSPWALLCVDRYLFIAMAGSHQIWVLIDEQQIGPFAGSGAEALVDGPLAQCGFNQPSDLAEGLGHFFVADPEASALRAISLADEPKTITLLGQGLFDYGDQDGNAQEALLQHPSGLTFHQERVYIADTYNHKIKVFDPFKGQVASLIGSGQPGNADGSFQQARLYEPEGLTHFQGSLLIADTNNHLIRVADLAGQTLATLELEHLERLAALPEPASPPRRRSPITISPGVVHFTLSFRLPEGTQINEEAPSTLQVEPDGLQLAIVTPQVSWTASYTADQEITLEAALYYCDHLDGRICMVAFIIEILPLLVSPTGAPEVALTIDIPGPP